MHPSNTPGSKVVTGRQLLSKAISVMRLTTLRNRFTVVSSQLVRFRLLPTAQAMNGLGGASGLKLTVTSPTQLLNASAPTSVNAFGSASEVILLQPENAFDPKVVNEFGSVREVIPSHPLNAEVPIFVNEFGSAREVIPLQPANV